MERKGYPDKFDHKTASTESELDIRELERKTEKFNEKKEKCKVNIIEFLVGGILLFFCFQYLQQHPAEKVALMSGFEVITQKVRVFFTEKSDSLQTKYDLERSFDEVISLAKEGACLENKDLQEIENRLDALKAMDIDTFATQKAAFINYLRQQYLAVKKACEE